MIRRKGEGKKRKSGPSFGGGKSGSSPATPKNDKAPPPSASTVAEGLEAKHKPKPATTSCPAPAKPAPVPCDDNFLVTNYKRPLSELFPASVAAQPAQAGPESPLGIPQSTAPHPAGIGEDANDIDSSWVVVPPRDISSAAAEAAVHSCPAQPEEAGPPLAAPIGGNAPALPEKAGPPTAPMGGDAPALLEEAGPPCAPIGGHAPPLPEAAGPPCAPIGGHAPPLPEAAGPPCAPIGGHAPPLPEAAGPPCAPIGGHAPPLPEAAGPPCAPIGGHAPPLPEAAGPPCAPIGGHAPPLPEAAGPPCAPIGGHAPPLPEAAGPPCAPIGGHAPPLPEAAGPPTAPSGEGSPALPENAGPPTALTSGGAPALPEKAGRPSAPIGGNAPALPAEAGPASAPIKKPVKPYEPGSQAARESPPPPQEVLPHELIFYPFAYALLSDSAADHCWYCLAEGSLKKCTGCGHAWFCGKTCLQRGWQEHRPECQGIKRLGHLPDIEVRMLGRIAHRFLCIEEGRDKKESFYLNRHSRRSVMEIWSHSQEMRNDKAAWKRFLDVHVKLMVFYDAKFLPASQDTIFELHCRNYINRHAINDSTYMREIGKGLYLDLCAYDHSCAPTAVYICDGLKASLRALKPGIDLRDRTQTFYTYIDLLRTKAERQAMLLDSWYFRCCCPRCASPEEHLLTAIKCPACEEAVPLASLASMRSLPCTGCGAEAPSDVVAKGKALIADLVQITQADHFARASSQDELTKLAKAVVGKFRQQLPFCNIYMTRLLQCLIGHTDPEHVSDLLFYHEAATPVMRLCFPRNHPALAYHLMNIGIFKGKLDPAQGRAEFVEARDMMRVVFDPDHHMLQVLASFFAE